MSQLFCFEGVGALIKITGKRRLGSGALISAPWPDWLPFLACPVGVAVASCSSGCGVVTVAQQGVGQVYAVPAKSEAAVWRLIMLDDQHQHRQQPDEGPTLTWPWRLRRPPGDRRHHLLQLSVICSAATAQVTKAARVQQQPRLCEQVYWMYGGHFL